MAIEKLKINYKNKK